MRCRGDPGEETKQNRDELPDLAARKFTSGSSDALMLVGAPFAGLSFLPQEDGSLVLDGGQQRYTFARQGDDDD